MKLQDKDMTEDVSSKSQKQLIILHEDEFQRSLRHRNLPPIEKLKSFTAMLRRNRAIMTAINKKEE